MKPSKSGLNLWLALREETVAELSRNAAAGPKQVNVMAGQQGRVF